MVDIRKPPYFSTFDEAQKYYRILARPGRPIQAREWNDLQEQMQKQIERVGAHLFENGAQVLPGTNDGVTYRDDIGFIKLTNTSTASVASTEEAIKNLWLGKTVVSTSGSIGVEAKVIGYKVSDTLAEARLFIDYVKADSSLGTTTVFSPGQSIQTVETVPSSATISSDLTAVGKISGVFIKNSVYFFNGDFILVDEQSVFIEPSDPATQSAWNNTPTAKVGLNVEKSIVTFEEDEALGDNANPSDSFGSPGADRLAIIATLEQREYNEQSDGKFIELLKVSNGVVQTRVRRTEYSVLEDTMARRTYDESGDYTVRDFQIDVKPYFLEDDNGGFHVIEEFLFESQEDAEKAGELLFNNAAACQAPLPNQSKWLPASSPSKFYELVRSKLTLQIDPGKAYVKGYEIEKLAPTYIDVDKARSLRFQNNRTVNVELGSFVYVTNVFGTPEIDQYELVQIHSVLKTSYTDTTASSSTLLGTARILAIEYFAGTHGEAGTSLGADSPANPAVAGAIYKLYLFDVNANPGKDILQMKKIVSTSGSSFSADLSLEFASLEGSISVGSPATTLVGNGTSFVNKSSQKLTVGDYIRVGNSNSQIFRVTAVASDTSITVNRTASFTGNQAISFAYASFHGEEAAPGLVFPLPEKFAYTIRSADVNNTPNSVIDTTFSVRRRFAQVAASSNKITINLNPASTEEFVPYSPNDYIVINRNTSDRDWLKLYGGSSYDSSTGSAGVQITGDNRQLIVYLPAGNTDTYDVIATVLKSGGISAQERTKTARRGSFSGGQYTNSGGTGQGAVVTASGKTDLSVISLGRADILKVTRIVMSGDFSAEPSSLETLPSTSRDITDRYQLDNGQRDYYYDIGSVYLKPGAERPTGRVRVEFDYFEHSSGAYFSVDSYPFNRSNPAENTMDYAEIPQFTDSAGRVYDLRDCIDFRPIKTTSTSFTTVDVPRSNIRLDFHHYLNRADNLYLDRFGFFRIAKGTPEITPISAATPADGMSLCDLDLVAYTAGPEQCFIRKKDNRRYTMRDIGKIEQRVSNLEYYTLLSLLEKEAKDLEVKDAQGLDRFKNGFIVDNFATHGIGLIGDIDHRCSIDPRAQELRPSINQKSVSLIESNGLITQEVTRKQARDTNNYALTGKLYTLKYSTVPFIEQELASQVENVNPYKKFTFKGRISLNPSTDTWRDTNRLPKLQVVDETAFKAAQAGVNPDAVIWGEWEEFSKVSEDKREKLPKKITYGPNKPDAVHSKNWPRYVTTRTKVTTTTTTTNIRQGYSEQVVGAGYKTESLGDRIVSITPAYYIRSRDVIIDGKGFLPNAQLYAFFDDEPVGEYCQQAGGVLGGPLRADQTGSINLTFTIPAGKFLTGERIFKLTTSPSNELSPSPASDGESKYQAVGWIDNVQETELSIRQFEVQRIPKTDTDTITSEQTNIETKTKKEDPIAQSFTVQEKGGCFLLAVDIFFYTKDPNIPIKLQLRPMSNDGYPTIFLMPFGEVVKPAADVITNVVNLNSGTITVTGNGTIPGYTTGPWPSTPTNPEEIQRVTNKSGTAVSNGTAFSFNRDGAHLDMIPTRFVFSSPIYLQEGNDYAIVLLSDSAEYQTWVSQAGPITPRPGGVPVFGKDVNTKIGTTIPILEDNYLSGVFFRSSNGTTWNADQLVDMKFALHKAKFVTNQTATIEYVNESIEAASLVNDPIITKTGNTRIRVLHRNHGYVLPSSGGTPQRVKFSGFQTVNGLTATLINRAEGWPIESMELDSYVINVGVAATGDGRCGGSNITATDCVSMNTMFFSANQITFPDAPAFWTCSTTNGGNVSYIDTSTKAIPFAINPFVEVEPNQTTNFAFPMTVLSDINEQPSTVSIPTPSKASGTGANRKSLKLKAVLRTKNENISPVLDSERISAIAVSNRINNPNGSGSYTINVSGLDDLQVIPTGVATASSIKFYDDTTGINKGRFETENATVAEHLSKIDVGKLITITGTSGNARNKTNVKVLEMSYTPAATVKCSIVVDTTFTGGDPVDAGTVDITQKDNFVDEIAPAGGSAGFKYVTKQLTLARPSTSLKITFDANRHESNDIEVYYRILRKDSTTPFEDLNWVKAEFNLEQNSALVAAYPDPNSLIEEFTSYSATINNLPPFVGFAIKIVGKGGNSSRPPRISNLMGIALDE